MWYDAVSRKWTARKPLNCYGPVDFYSKKMYFLSQKMLQKLSTSAGYIIGDIPKPRKDFPCITKSLRYQRSSYRRFKVVASSEVASANCGILTVVRRPNRLYDPRTSFITTWSYRLFFLVLWHFISARLRPDVASSSASLFIWIKPPLTVLILELIHERAIAGHAGDRRQQWKNTRAIKNLFSVYWRF